MHYPRMRQWILVLWSAGLAVTGWSGPRLADVFGDGMVLQRDIPVPVWGESEPDQEVTVTFADASVRTRADATGHWRCMLPPMSASVEARELKVAAATGTAMARDVLVGEVWLCAGQSNMELRLSYSENGVAVAKDARDDRLRFFRVPRRVAELPAEAVAARWERCGPEAAGDFSAVGFYFGRMLRKELDVPVGLIEAAHGGSPVESWTPLAAVLKAPAEDAALERFARNVLEYPGKIASHDAALAEWNAAAKVAGKTLPRKPVAPNTGPDSHFRPAGLWNGMVAPVVPYALRGVVWYQAETNGTVSGSGEYARNFPRMIDAWRSEWRRPELPLIFVQLPNYSSGDADGLRWAHLREEQTAGLTRRQTAMAVTIDLGERDNIHPKNKEAVARRLVALALNRVYGRATHDTGPVYRGYSVRGREVTVTFATTDGAGLVAAPAGLTGFELAGPDGVFHTATGQVKGANVVLTADGVTQPAAVRYAFRNAPVAGLFDDRGWPVAPFRTDGGEEEN